MLFCLAYIFVCESVSNDTYRCKLIGLSFAAGIECQLLKRHAGELCPETSFDLSVSYVSLCLYVCVTCTCYKTS